jgi:hypothetical protein
MIASPSKGPNPSPCFCGFQLYFATVFSSNRARDPRRGRSVGWPSASALAERPINLQPSVGKMQHEQDDSRKYQTVAASLAKPGGCL